VRIPRLLTITGPAAVLYVLAARASSSSGSSPEWLVAGLSLAMALTPIAVLGARPARRISSLAWIGVTLAVALASAHAASPPLNTTHDVAWLVATLLMLDLALPPDSRALLRYGALAGLAFASVLASALARAGLLPTDALAIVVVAGLLGIGAVHQVALVGRGHAVEGALCGIAVVAIGVGLAYAWVGPLSGALATIVEFAVASLLWLGHLAWIDPRWRSLRRVGVPVVLACVASFLAAYLVAPAGPLARWEIGIVALGSGLVWWLSFSFTRRLAQLSVWSTAGRLPEAVAAARRSLVGSTTLESIAASALPPLQTPGDDAAALPELYAFEPPLRIRLESVGRTLIRPGDLPAAIVTACSEGNPHSVLDVVTLRPRVVREPQIRDLVELMERRSIGAVLPCAHFEHLEGVLLLPLGTRSEPLSRIELEELGHLGEALGSAMSTALAQRRAETHIHRLAELRQAAEERIASLEGEVQRLRGQCDVLGRGLVEDHTLHVAYSPSMRRVQTRAIELAPTDEPVLLVAAAGSPVLPVSRFIHDRGPRWNAPFVVADCSASAPEDVINLLFGSDEGRIGWFNSDAQGTLLLRDLPALPHTVQERLAAVLRRRSHSADDDEVGSTALRLIATSRLPLDRLRHESALAPELDACFAGAELEIPRLRERREDLPSLALLSIDRACRVHARDPIGIDQSAMSALVDHDWPGDVAELDLVIERAVAKAAGKTITVADLPPLAWPGDDDLESLEGSYVEVERRLLQRALRRSGGNKSEAARRLGLKRTTFLDKLRRYGLEQPASEGVGDEAVG
jgi:DNA-binding NtrC family response regulator